MWNSYIVNIARVFSSHPIYKQAVATCSMEWYTRTNSSNDLTSATDFDSWLRDIWLAANHKKQMTRGQTGWRAPLSLKNDSCELIIHAEGDDRQPLKLHVHKQQV